MQLTKLLSVVVNIKVFPTVTTSSLCSAVVVLVLLTKAVFGQQAVKPHRILFILNGSTGMGQSWQGQAAKYRLASQFITGLAEEMYRHNDDIQFGLRIYGHLFPVTYNICNDSRQEVRFSKENYYQLSLRLQDVKPNGSGALNYAAAEALANELSDTTHYQYSIVVISDTSRQCQGGNCLPPAVANRKFYRKYLIEFGRATPGNCYDSVFGGDPAGYRTMIDHIISQYPVKGEFAIKEQQRADTVRIPVYIRKPSGQPNTPRPDTAEAGTAIIYNTNQLYTIVLYKEEQGWYRRMEEVFFSGAASKAIRLKPGMYKAAFMVNGVEHAERFAIEKGVTTEVRVE